MEVQGAGLKEAELHICNADGNLINRTGTLGPWIFGLKTTCRWIASIRSDKVNSVGCPFFNIQKMSGVELTIYGSINDYLSAQLVCIEIQ